MNSAEINDIQTTWKIIVADPVASGSAILIGFFTKYPSNLSKFPSFQNVPVNELKNNARFKAHCTRIIRTFDESVKALEEADPIAKLEDIWGKVAENHMPRHIEKQAYNELKEIILATLVPAAKMNDDQIAAWSKVVDVIYDILFKSIDTLKAAGQ